MDFNERQQLRWSTPVPLIRVPTLQSRWTSSQVSNQIGLLSIIWFPNVHQRNHRWGLMLQFQEANNPFINAYIKAVSNCSRFSSFHNTFLIKKFKVHYTKVKSDWQERVPLLDSTFTWLNLFTYLLSCAFKYGHSTPNNEKSLSRWHCGHHKTIKTTNSTVRMIVIESLQFSYIAQRQLNCIHTHTHTDARAHTHTDAHTYTHTHAQADPLLIRCASIFLSGILGTKKVHINLA